MSLLVQGAAVGLAGGAGAALRSAAEVRGLARGRKPQVTATVNAAGSLLLGLLVGLLAGRHPDLLAALGTGLCGGLTTFSGWVVDAVAAARDGQGRTAALVAVAPLLVGLLCAALGITVGLAVAGR